MIRGFKSKQTGSLRHNTKADTKHAWNEEDAHAHPHIHGRAETAMHLKPTLCLVLTSVLALLSCRSEPSNLEDVPMNVHELRNPLAAVQLHTNGMLSKLVDPSSTLSPLETPCPQQQYPTTFHAMKTQTCPSEMIPIKDMFNAPMLNWLKLLLVMLDWECAVHCFYTILGHFESSHSTGAFLLTPT